MKTKFIVLLLFSFNQLIFAQIDHWETAVLANGDWKYQTGSASVPNNWNEVEFNDNAWSEGEGSIGYGDEDDNTVISQTVSLYMRKTFNIEDLSKIETALFHADFDDGFVAYLNGVEIARFNLLGNPPNYNTEAPELREAEMYQGGSPIGFALNADLLNEGENVLAVQTHNFDGTASSDLTTLYWLSFAINDDSNDYFPAPSWFLAAGFESNLPLVTINTWGNFIPTEEIEGEMGIIWNGEGFANSSLESPNEFFGKISINRRGQSSLALFPKNGFAIETKDENGEDMDVAFLNFPEEEDWILHGPYSDKSLIRNVLAMDISRKMGHYASRTRLVELLINEQYEGIYVLMERIKQDKNRVDIADLNPEDIEGDELTGGYVFKIDKGEVDWSSNYNKYNNSNDKLKFTYVSPKRTAIQPEQEAYIQAYVDSFETAVLNPNITYGGKRYDEFIDLASFADYFILKEFSKDVDAYRISSYFHKDKNSKGGRIKATPVWDFNIAFGNADYCIASTSSDWIYYNCGIDSPFWWNNMFQDSSFVNVVHCRWNELREGPLHLDSLFAFIDEKAALLEPAVDRNFQRWPVLGEYVWPNPVVSDSYEEAVDYLKEFIENRTEWMDANIFGTECVLPVIPVDTMTNVAYPNLASNFDLLYNPNDQIIYLDFPQTNESEFELAIFNMAGRLGYTEQFSLLDSSHQVSTKNLPVGTYVLQLQNALTGQISGIRKLVVLP